MITIEQAIDINEADVKIINKGLDANAMQLRGQKPVEFFAFFMRDEKNQIVGGCSGFMYYGCLYLDQLWIDAQYRGQDYGSKLVRAAEQMAHSKGCTFSTTETMDWEGLDFYKKLGYYLESEQHGYTNDAVMYRLRKDW
ncbi:MAG TPA: GNAT family N-acetyltransferase [Gammaproteobacteria bacterium]|nr:GNAT family N-acetyltransferase [Gammaproteobacteria bacterium]